MKLVLYEIKKVISKRVFLIILGLCFVLNIAIFYYSQNSYEDKIYASAEYVDFVNKYSDMDFARAEQELSEKNTVYDILMYMNMMADAQTDEEFDEYIKLLENYKSESPIAYAEAENLSNSGNYQNEQWYVHNLQSQIEYIKSYPAFINEMYDRANEQSSFSVFGNDKNFSYKNLYKTANDYKQLSSVKLTIGNNTPVTSAAEYRMTDYFLIAVVFLLCIYLFYYERERGLYNLVRSSRNGGLKTIIAKFAALFIILTVISIIFAISIYTTSSYIYGEIDFSRAIQSIPDYRNCIFNVNIGEFCMLTILSKLIGVLVTAAIFSLLFVCFSSPALMYSASIGIVVIEFLLNVLISSSSGFNYLKYINLFYLLDGNSFWGIYLNLNLFSNPVSAYFVNFIIFSVVFAIITAITCVLFTLKTQIKKESWISSIIDRIRSKHFKIKGNTSIFCGEVWKYFVQNKMAFFFVLFIGYGVFSSIGTVSYPYTDISDPSYKAYMEYLEGDITNEKIDYINKENEYFNLLNQRIDEIALDSSLSENAKGIEIKSIQNILNSKGVAFEQVYAQYKRLLELQNRGIDAQFIDEKLYPNFVANSFREWKDSVFMLLALLIAIPSIYTTEYKNNMINLIRPNKLGKLRLWFNKYIISVILLLIIFAVIYLPYLIRFISTYGTQSLLTQLVCLLDYQATNGQISVIGAFLLNSLCYLFIGLLSSGIIILISNVSKNYLMSMIISTIALIIPCIVIYSADSIRIGEIFNGNYALSAVVVIVMSLLLTSICQLTACLYFTNLKLRRWSNV